MHGLIVSSCCFRTGLLLQLIGCYSQYGGDGKSSIMLVIDFSLKGNVSRVITSRNMMAWLPYTLKQLIVFWFIFNMIIIGCLL